MHRTDAHIAIALTGDGAPLDPAVHLLWSDCRGAYRLCPADREDMPTARSLLPLLAAGVTLVGCRSEPAPWRAEWVGVGHGEPGGVLRMDPLTRPALRLTGSAPPTPSIVLRQDGRDTPLTFDDLQRGPHRLLRVDAMVHTTAQRLPAASKALCLIADGRERCWPARWPSRPEAAGSARLEHEGADHLAARIGSLAPAHRGDAYRALARALRREGRSREAIEAWDRAADAALADGRIGEAARALRAAAFMACQAGDFDRAERDLDRAAEILGPRASTADRLREQYYRGLVSRGLSRLRDATTHFERVAEEAWATGEDDLFGAAIEMLAVQLVDQGRAREAREAIDDIRLRDVATRRAPTDRAIYLNNRAWIALVAVATGSAPSDELPRVIELLDAAMTLVESARERRGILVNRAWAHLLRDDIEAARQAIDQVDGAADDTAAELIRAEIALRGGMLDEAGAAFDRAAGLAAEQSAGLPTDETWRAAYGRGRVAAARGDAAAALGHFRAALDGLDAVAAQAGVWHARARFYADRRPLVDDTARLLVSGGDLAGAFAVIDRTNARALRALEARTRLDRLPPAVRAEWEALQSRFAAARQAWDDARDDGELLDGAEAAAWQAAQAERRREMVAAFEAAEALLTREAPIRTAASDAEAIAAALPPKTALVAFGRLGQTVHAFWLEAERPIAHAVVEATADAGDDDPKAAAALIAPFAARLAGLDHLYVVPGDVPAARALATAPAPSSGSPESPDTPDTPGAPLGTRLSLSDLPYAGALVRPRRAASGPVLVVADPTVDLPHAHAEGRRVAEALPDARLLARGAATREAVREAMSRVRAMHYAGHGVARADSPWQAHLALAGGTTLTVADILTADVPAGTVVLSGCRTGVRGALSDREALGLADAFVAAGSRAVLATRRDIPDEAAARFIARFHAEGGLDRPGPALRAATAAFFRLGDPIWSAFRLTGHP